MFIKVFVNSKEGTLGNDPELRSIIQHASKNNPRYLFRVWSSNSGGDSTLNTTSAVTPHAFAPDYNTGHNSIFEMKSKWFIKNLIGHFRAQRIPSEFSSWTASPVFAIRVAFHFAERKRPNVHIAIVDTEKLKDTNMILSVLSTEPVFRSHSPDHVEMILDIEYEYLIHGVVDGEAYKAVALTALSECGLSDYFSGMRGDPAPYSNWIGRHRIFKLPGPAMPLSPTEAKSLLNIAGLYGKPSHIPFFVALVCCKLRPGLLTKPDLSEINKIIKLLGGHNQIPDWSASRGVFCNNIYYLKYDDGRQMQIIMRALNYYCLGRGARYRVLDDMELLVGGLSALGVDNSDSFERGRA
ncbi:hypothetical protein D6D13_01288 [Aureobasidium pullulans]|uniref:DUF7587 domain-containing protein n=1 Tax=Aureobasidium pullulans TaxID=5580 RepID=A0A4S9D876_AURPU|nr:hypothetical protein D6D13_01288 [Aureobasidium pullulans]